MAEILLSSEMYIKSVTNISDNLAPKYLLSALREAQEVSLKSILGDALLEKLKSLVESREIDEAANEKYKYLLGKCQYYLAYMTIVEVINKVSFKIGNAGLVKTSDENMQVASMDEIISLAAIVQEEATTAKEMGKVSSVIHNRIENPSYRRIQCDVTIHYINDYVTDSPYIHHDTEKYKELYNTYKCVGLPAGAITNPGIDAIKAALYPEDTNYFFFVTDKDWNYYYAETYAEHKKNCAAVGLVG